MAPEIWTSFSFLLCLMCLSHTKALEWHPYIIRVFFSVDPFFRPMSQDIHGPSRVTSQRVRLLSPTYPLGYCLFHFYIIYRALGLKRKKKAQGCFVFRIHVHPVVRGYNPLTPRHLRHHSSHGLALGSSQGMRSSLSPKFITHAWGKAIIHREMHDTFSQGMDGRMHPCIHATDSSTSQSINFYVQNAWKTIIRCEMHDTSLRERTYVCTYIFYLTDSSTVSVNL